MKFSSGSGFSSTKKKELLRSMWKGRVSGSLSSSTTNLSKIYGVSLSIPGTTILLKITPIFPAKKAGILSGSWFKDKKAQPSGSCFTSNHRQT